MDHLIEVVLTEVWTYPLEIYTHFEFNNKSGSKEPNTSEIKDFGKNLDIT